LIIVLCIDRTGRSFPAAGDHFEYRPDKPETAEMKVKPDIPANDSVFRVLIWNVGYFGLGKGCDFFFDGPDDRPSENNTGNIL
jgi:hypothetical protein